MKTPRRRSRYELIPVTCSVCGKLWRIVTGPGDAPLAEYVGPCCRWSDPPPPDEARPP